MAERQPSRSSIDYTAVRALRQQVSKELTAALRDLTNVTTARRQAEGERIAARLVQEHCDIKMRELGEPVTPQEEAALLDAVAADLFGLGRLQGLLDRKDVINIHILGYDQVRIELADGQIIEGEPIADSDEDMIAMFQVLAMRAGATERSLSSTKPWLDMQLPDGSRLTVVYQVSVRPYAVIRRHTLIDVTLDELRDTYGAIDDLLCGFLKAAMRAGLNIMVAGLADAGKSTMLRALASEISPKEAFITQEESRELGLHDTGRHKWAMSLEAREGHGARGADGRVAGEVTMSDLSPLTLRMSVQRIIVGEVRSREIVPMLQAMATSKGSMCTIHARDSRSVMDRIIELALQHGQEMRADLARRMAAGAIDLILYLTVEDETLIGGRKLRYASELVEVGGMSGEQVVTTLIFGPGADGRAVPRNVPDRLAGALRRVGYDARILSSYIQLGENNAGAWTRPLPTVGQAR
ncbi:protein kinase [Actinoplanes regularis]|nr:CpaF/VirB11 family protein [Actinoplanes regularis]GLW34478.1 protein kinase [Actinoplanes regularis]